MPANHHSNDQKKEKRIINRQLRAGSSAWHHGGREGVCGVGRRRKGETSAHVETVQNRYMAAAARRHRLQACAFAKATKEAAIMQTP